MPSRQAQYDVLTKAIARVLTPVMICMALAVWFVHSLGTSTKCDAEFERKFGDISLSVPDQASEDSGDTTYSTLSAGIFIGIFVALMVIFTFLIVYLYKSGRTKILQVWLKVSVFLIFAYVGGLYIYEFCHSRCIDLDWISLVLAVWNFTVTGLFAIFSVVPRLVNQAYLILMSALMAYIFRAIPAWGIWTILGVLAAWDLFAVLHPKGPLNMLVKYAREKGDPLPALVYDTNPNDAGREDDPNPAKVRIPQKNTERGDGSTHTSESDASQKKARKKRSPSRKKRAPNPDEDAKPKDDLEAGPAANAEPSNDAEEDYRVGTMGAHLKLGLGDFVFYSILVAEASKSSAMTAVTSFVAILAGLCATLFLVTVCRKALPALPISIIAGLLVYFLTRYAIQPFVHNLLPELLFH